MPIADHIRLAQVVLPCPDLAASLRFFTAELGFKVNLILPADSPSRGRRLGTWRHPAARSERRAAKPKGRWSSACSATEQALPAGTPGEMIAPGGTRIELVDAHPPMTLPEGRQEFVLTRMAGAGRPGARGAPACSIAI